MFQFRIFLRFVVCILILLAVSPLCLAQEQILSIEEVTQIDLGTEINCIAINEKLNRIYVGVNDTVVVINGTSKQVMKTVKIDLEPYSEVNWIVVDSLNNQIWAIASHAGEIYIIDGETYAIRDTPWTGARGFFALDPLRKRVYLTDTTFVLGDFDKVNFYNSTDFTILGHIDIPGSDINPTVEYFYILLDTELNRIYVDWFYTTFVFDCASGSLISDHTSPGSLINDYTQVYENKIYTSNGIVDANTLQYISYFNTRVRAIDPRNSTVYGMYNDPKHDYTYTLQAMDASTNKTLASSDYIFGHDECQKAIINLQTDEIYLGGEPGLLYVLAIISSPPPVQGTPGTYIIVAVVIITILVIAGIAIVLRRRKAHR